MLCDDIENSLRNGTNITALSAENLDVDYGRIWGNTVLFRGHRSGNAVRMQSQQMLQPAEDQVVDR